MFQLDPQLQIDTMALGDFPLCRLLLMKDANYPWFILVPRRPGLQEIYQLEDQDQYCLCHESSHLSRALAAVFAADKINIAALGNVVSQLHIHHIVRYHTDPAWPKPVWGLRPCKPYEPGEAAHTGARILEHLNDFVPQSNFPWP
jgi:diadenosine tetraphosphate (Ap4A) HIT family hydrolase